MTAFVNCPTVDIEDDRTGLSVETLRRALADNLFYIQGKWPEVASTNDFYLALAYTVRDRMMPRWLSSTRTLMKPEVRVVTYLSAEFLLGPHLGRNLINLGIEEPVKQAVAESGLDFTELIAQEEEPGLGNGGLGRLAACYMESLASEQIPAIGYGIRYEFGIFDQEIRDGWQCEITDKWLQYGNPWEIPHPEASVTVGFGGHTEGYTDSDGRFRKRWIPGKQVKGIPYDTPIPGYRVNTVNTLRLWKAEAVESFDFQSFNVGNYYGAVDSKVTSENISKVLYPNDEQLEGKQLRLEQQYFFTACALQDMIRIHLASGRKLDSFCEKFTAQMNDTHPAVAVAELMRLLVDEHGMGWDEAWAVTQKTLAYTNHTLLPEALEKWSLSLFGSLLPRHLEIIFEINQRFMDDMRVRYMNDPGKLAALSLIDDNDGGYVRMANLASLGSYAINGVAALHSELVKKTILKDFHELFPGKIRNVTNGVTPRRWIALANPRLAALYTEKIGDGWLHNLEEIGQLEGYADDPGFRAHWRQIKRDIKQELATYIYQRTGIAVSPDSMFDILVKRIHEYKRQHLDVLHIITLYERLKANPNLDMAPRTFIFGGKAAPGYAMAKLMIKFITAVGDVINHDPTIGDRLKVVFLPDYNVKFGQRVYPAADLSEQISTAGKEASGTGNMKFSMNGALTIGTLDGANVEIRELVGDDNFFLFGLTTDGVDALKASGYNPWDYYTSNPQLKEVIDLVQSGFFAKGDSNLFRPLTDKLLYDDPFMLMADYQSYIDCQDRIGAAYQDQEHWSRLSIINAVRMGKFSSDRAIRDYCRDIWQVSPAPVEMMAYDQSQAGLRV
ncbi:glycogen/starch/alpha-glucan phosphorylase [Nodosilinea sp. P-1105]|uniref:glycogen/starch/alpha-glucan phosphorylase n=1 Tax=Nodosilinea sp. P-1105 TaxID=2546229 RepID=UPI00146E4B67|nr:glycogen/starch/alpha-glucan phosphorylase [Nodosilinea sp. P-1105]NMF86206.1 glycogen/starch/alpha-glucan phosphorylase [Nodosilinea sp. P-1105]